LHINGHPIKQGKSSYSNDYIFNVDLTFLLFSNLKMSEKEILDGQFLNITPESKIKIEIFFFKYGISKIILSTDYYVTAEYFKILSCFLSF
jgi:hypothetical protein